MGIISNAMQSAPAAPAQSAASSAIADPILSKTKASVEAKVSPQIKKQFLSIENAGLAILSHGDMPKMVLQKIQSNPDVTAVVSDGVANLISMIYNQVAPKVAQEKLQEFNASFVAAVPSASVALMCQVLDMAAQALHTQITQQLVAACTQQTAQKVLGKFHIGNQQIQQAVAAGQARQGA